MTAVYTAEQVAKHNTKNDLWVSIHGKVYDLTTYLEDHPGGVAAVIEVAGQDATDAFEDLGHSEEARETMARFVVGRLDHDEDAAPKKVPRQLKPVPEAPAKHYLTASNARLLTDILLTSIIVVTGFTGMRRFGQYTFSHNWHIPRLLSTLLPWATSTGLLSMLGRRAFHRQFPPQIKPKRPLHFKVKATIATPQASTNTVLDPHKFIDLPVTSIEKISPDSNKIILALPTDTSTLGLPVGQHISIRATINGSPVSRSYTPTSSNKDLGRLELVIKNYDTGLLTGNYLKTIKPGDKLSICGPKGQMRYRRGLAKNIGMIAGGSGITPIYQLVRAICEDPRDDTKIVLLYANQREEDILLKAELDAFAAAHADQVQIHYLLSKPSADWTGRVGRITPELVQQTFAPAEDKMNKAMICGPRGMVDCAKGWLVDLGYDRANAVSKMTDQIFVF